eukprot:TRINITY_DN21766_c0_g1_i1.p2 TRINITY_DN21766_c0_g1~~TRINITY_DN21766_c0_g1_i1.p2  ORF type:complete len:230 (+),score=49.09 TRINITY_DN21766_c0_g1_i1:544-1233(+)
MTFGHRACPAWGGEDGNPRFMLSAAAVTVREGGPSLGPSTVLHWARPEAPNATYPSVEKNWIPIPAGGSAWGVTVALELDGGVLKHHAAGLRLAPAVSFLDRPPVLAVDEWRRRDNLRHGGTNYVLLRRSRGDVLVAMLHWRTRPVHRGGRYQHAWYAVSAAPPFGPVGHVSEPFQLPVVGRRSPSRVQFASGLAQEDRYLYLSYSDADCTALLTRYRVVEVEAAVGLR